MKKDSALGFLEELQPHHHNLLPRTVPGHDVSIDPAHPEITKTFSTQAAIDWELLGWEKGKQKSEPDSGMYCTDQEHLKRRPKNQMLFQRTC